MTKPLLDLSLQVLRVEVVRHLGRDARTELHTHELKQKIVDCRYLKVLRVIYLVGPRTETGAWPQARPPDPRSAPAGRSQGAAGPRQPGPLDGHGFVGVQQIVK